VREALLQALDVQDIKAIKDTPITTLLTKSNA
jgi:hypothetical protein